MKTYTPDAMRLAIAATRYLGSAHEADRVIEFVDWVREGGADLDAVLTKPGALGLAIREFLAQDDA